MRDEDESDVGLFLLYREMNTNCGLQNNVNIYFSYFYSIFFEGKIKKTSWDQAAEHLSLSLAHPVR